jgi:hypothetical protein
MLQEIFAYPTMLISSVFLVLATSIILIIIAILSAKAMGGRLGMGLKKIAAGSIMHATLYFLLILFQNGWGTTLDPDQLRYFFLIVSALASIILIAGFYQIYKISRELKLFY